MTTRNCANCVHSKAYQEADRVGLKCGLDGTILTPAYKSKLTDSYHAEIMARVARYSATCSDFVADV